MMTRIEEQVGLLRTEPQEMGDGKPKRGRGPKRMARGPAAPEIE